MAKKPANAIKNIPSNQDPYMVNPRDVEVQVPFSRVEELLKKGYSLVEGVKPSKKPAPSQNELEDSALKPKSKAELKKEVDSVETEL